MNVRLRQDDAAAVDLLLDRAASAQGNGNGDGSGAMLVSTNHASVATDRLAAVERVLHVLDAMPNGDPSPDLLQRTLQRVEAGTPAAMRPAAAALIDPARPMA